jgi:hypothetical protein
VIGAGEDRIAGRDGQQVALIQDKIRRAGQRRQIVRRARLDGADGDAIGDQSFGHVAADETAGAGDDGDAHVLAGFQSAAVFLNALT